MFCVADVNTFPLDLTFFRMQLFCLFLIRLYVRAILTNDIFAFLRSCENILSGKIQKESRPCLAALLQGSHYYVCHARFCLFHYLFAFAISHIFTNLRRRLSTSSTIRTCNLVLCKQVTQDAFPVPTSRYAK